VHGDTVPMNAMEPPDSHHLLAAQGWLGLGNHVEADKELEKIAPQLRNHPDFLEIRWSIRSLQKNWEACVDIANALMGADPDRVTGRVRLSFALHELTRTEEAYINLAAVCDDFPHEWVVPYNLACYCSQLGELAEAKEWFKKSIAIDDKAATKAGIDDPDLKPLWESMYTPI